MGVAKDPDLFIANQDRSFILMEIVFLFDELPRKLLESALIAQK
jgi:hypothetical protein